MLLAEQLKTFIMKKSLIIAISILLTMAACKSNKYTEAATDKDSTAVAAQSSLAGDDTMDHHLTQNNNASIMDIKDKSMHEMQAMQSTGDVDLDFAAMMKLHHMSAIESSQLVLQNGSDPALKTMAQKMLRDQQKEVDEFNAFISARTTHQSNSSFFKKSMDAMDKMNMNMDHSGSVDRQFVVMMIPHHKGAIDMSELYLTSGGKSAELKQMANNIISSQQKEIKELEGWLSKN